MTDRRTLLLDLTALVCALFLVTVVPWLVVAWQRSDVRADRAESTLEHVTRACEQRADGSAECPVRTFTPITTTTTSTTEAK